VIFVVASFLLTLGVATAAVWPPAWWQAGLLGLLPAAFAAVALDVPIARTAGWLISILGPLALLLVLPVVPWRRTWARWAVPASVALVLVAIAVAARGDGPILVILSLPFAMVLVGLVRAAAQHRHLLARPHAAHTPHKE
jgi:hypothetical protein